MSNEETNRDGFSSKWGFILACIGSAVGMGNIWRFPIMVQKYGGSMATEPRGELFAVKIVLPPAQS